MTDDNRRRLENLTLAQVALREAARLTKMAAGHLREVGIFPAPDVHRAASIAQSLESIDKRVAICIERIPS